MQNRRLWRPVLLGSRVPILLPPEAAVLRDGIDHPVHAHVLPRPLRVHTSGRRRREGLPQHHRPPVLLLLSTSRVRQYASDVRLRAFDKWANITICQWRQIRCLWSVSTYHNMPVTSYYVPLISEHTSQYASDVILRAFDQWAHITICQWRHITCLWSGSKSWIGFHKLKWDYYL